MTSPRRNLIRLPGGRAFAWTEWGPPAGRPVIFCTGAGMSGSLGFGEDLLDAFGLRLIAPDRPGLGRSDPDATRTLASWLADIRHLDLTDPVAVGFSQGAPFALALSPLVAAITIVCGQDDFGWPATASRLPAEVAAMVAEARRDPAGFERQIAGTATAGWLWTMIMTMSAPADRAVFEAPGFGGRYRACLDEGFAQGAAGYARDLVLTWNDWPMAPEAVAAPVQLWYGRQDTSPVHSPDFGATLARRLPRATLNVVEDQGSAILWTRARDILAGLR